MSGFSMEIFGVIVVAGIVVSILISVCRNHSMDAANDEYRNAAWTADQAIRRANAALKDLADVVQTPDAKNRIPEIRAKRAAYLTGRNEAIEMISATENAREEAYHTQRRGVRTQNLFLGGADDLSALSLYRRQNELAAISISERLIDPSAILEKANLLIHYQEMKREIMKEMEHTGRITA